MTEQRVSYPGYANAGVLTGVWTPGSVVHMRMNETPQEREARRVARVAKREAREAQEQASVTAVLGEGWKVTGYHRRGYTHFVVSPVKPASAPVTTLNWPSYDAPTLDEAIALALNAQVA